MGGRRTYGTSSAGGCFRLPEPEWHYSSVRSSNNSRLRKVVGCAAELGCRPSPPSLAAVCESGIRNTGFRHAAGDRAQMQFACVPFAFLVSPNLSVLTYDLQRRCAGSSDLAGAGVRGPPVAGPPRDDVRTTAIYPAGGHELPHATGGQPHVRIIAHLGFHVFGGC
jgi:hypothetical protein